MKIAIFHNFMDNIGGAEIVALTLARELDAELYTTNIDAEKIKKMGFTDVLPKMHSLGKVPANAPFRLQLAFLKFRRLDLGKKYAFYIIAGDWAMSGAVNHSPNLWYTHSPLNELWTFKNYVRNEVIAEFWKRPLFDIWVWVNRKLSKQYARAVEVFIGNSQNTQSRIKKIYGKNAEVINPPIETSSYYYQVSQGYWLSVNRLTKAKQIELQLRAFAKMPEEKLIIVGSYEKGSRTFENYKKIIEKITPKNVKIINWIDDAELKKLYAGCTGFIATSKDEDFGMAAVEAMASGKPVIAPNEGGYKETIIDGVTGKLIPDIDELNLIGAIKDVGKNPEAYREACVRQAKKFDTKVFIGKIKEQVELGLKK